jgi:hypothetical protein
MRSDATSQRHPRRAVRREGAEWMPDMWESYKNNQRREYEAYRQRAHGTSGCLLLAVLIVLVSAAMQRTAAPSARETGGE